MPQADSAINALLDACLATSGVSRLSEWDVLTFLYRHGPTLTSSELLARLLGYGATGIGAALDRLEYLGLIQRSRASEGVRLHYIAFSMQPFRHNYFQKIINLSDQRDVRLRVSRKLRHPMTRIASPKRAGLHLA